MKYASLGFRAHSGWTALVAVSTEKGQPQILMHQRPKLVEIFTYEFRQPYHTAEKMPLDKAREFVSRIESEANRLALESIRSVQKNLRKHGYELSCFGLPLTAAKPLPGIDKILASHALIHTADGELFRRALIHAGKRCKIVAFTLKERELLAVASETLGVRSVDLMPRLTALGKLIGSPWAQDEKIAALAAWLALVSHQANP